MFGLHEDTGAHQSVAGTYLEPELRTPFPNVQHGGIEISPCWFRVMVHSNDPLR